MSATAVSCPTSRRREHLRHFGPLLERGRKNEIGFAGITQIAVTNGPGLAACLAIGVAAAEIAALAWRIPVRGVNHLRRARVVAVHGVASRRARRSFPAGSTPCCRISG